MSNGISQFSVRLNHVLEGYGLSRSFIDYRRKLSIRIRQLYDDEDGEQIMFIGSKRDALCSFADTNSDIDIIRILQAIIFDEKSLDAAKDFIRTRPNIKLPVFILKNGPNSGYKYLQCLAFGPIIQPTYCTTFRQGTYFLNTANLEVLKDDLDTEKQIIGPAIRCKLFVSEEGEGPHFDIDIVLALHCPFLPFEFNEWCNRKRNYNWPPEWIIETTKKYGCLVVAVGHKSSDTEPLEWRLSLTKTEHLLTKSFNHVQIKCYVLMRLVLKWIIQPQMMEPLSSYHVKTVMFWMSEERERDFWRPENLAECFVSSLTKLKTFVENKNCPNYFLTDVNLLEGKLEGDIYEQILKVLDSLVTEGPAMVYRCLPLNVRLNGKICEHRSEELCTCLFQHLLCDRTDEINSSANKIDFNRVTEEIYKCSYFDLVDWYAINEIHNQSIYDSLTFSSMSLCEEMGLSNKKIYFEQKRYIAALNHNGYIARIKLATFLYYRRRLGHCIPLLLLVIKSMEASRELEICTEGETCAEHIEEIEGVECIYLTQNNKGFLVSEIVFSPCDQLLIPPDLQNEMRRQKTVNGTHYEGWVFVDSIVYAYYLLIVTLHDMRRYSGIASLFRRFHKVYTQEPGAIRIFRRDMAKRLYEHVFMLVWAAT